MIIERTVIVCDRCFRASCWQGIFMCEESQSAGIIEKTVSELRHLGLEHEDYWSDSNDVLGTESLRILHREYKKRKP